MTTQVKKMHPKRVAFLKKLQDVAKQQSGITIRLSKRVRYSGHFSNYQKDTVSFFSPGCCSEVQSDACRGVDIDIAISQTGLKKLSQKQISMYEKDFNAKYMVENNIHFFRINCENNAMRYLTFCMLRNITARPQRSFYYLWLRTHGFSVAESFMLLALAVARSHDAVKFMYYDTNPIMPLDSRPVWKGCIKKVQDVLDGKVHSEPYKLLNHIALAHNGTYFREYYVDGVEYLSTVEEMFDVELLKSYVAKA